MNAPSPAYAVDAGGSYTTVRVRRRDGREVISVRGEQLRRVDEVVAVAGGAGKAGAIRAVLRGGWATSLIADTSLATALLAEHPQQ